MSSAAQDVLEAALRLPRHELEELVGALSESLDSAELTDEWRAEIARRLVRIQAGEASFEDAHEHARRLRARLGA